MSVFTDLEYEPGIVQGPLRPRFYRGAGKFALVPTWRLRFGRSWYPLEHWWSVCLEWGLPETLTAGCNAYRHEVTIPLRSPIRIRALVQVEWGFRFRRRRQFNLGRPL